jgi:5-oxopent-3-ene-1,2,5-tricarboxylate decarboxylase/2-hydroxyhepta-2,4-diene-1,7-dioate isomerase
MNTAGSVPHGTVIGVALNNTRQLEAMAAVFAGQPYLAAPQSPVLFIKPENCISAHESPVAVPTGADSVFCNGSLAAVIGHRARRVPAAQAMSYIKGWTLFNDCSLAEDSFFRPPVRNKCRDGFGPLGPALAPVDALPEPGQATVRIAVNGVVARSTSTAELCWTATQLIAFITSFMTLEEDDVLAVGFAREPVEVRAGDRVAIEVDGIGALCNPIVRDEEIGASPPRTGTTLLALGLNYRDHASELEFKAPAEPLLFLKPRRICTADSSPCGRPAGAAFMHYEGELLAVIGRTARRVPRAAALDYVRGYTICNDFAVRDHLENFYRPNLRVKCRDSLTPVGPRIVPASDVSDPGNLRIRTFVNGELRQDGNTRDMIFDVPALIEYISEFMTLQPGDMISTGTPSGVSNVAVGDTVAVEIERIGRLENTIVAEPDL